MMSPESHVRLRRGLFDRTRAFAERRPYLWAFLGATAATAFSFVLIDRPVASWVAQHISPFSKRVMDALAHIANAEVYLIALVVLFVALQVLSRRFSASRIRNLVATAKNAVLFVFVSIVVTGLGGIAIKTALGRMRPRAFIEHGLYGFSPFNVTDFSMNSLPSGHTQFMFTLAMALTLIYPRYDAFYFFFAAGIGVLRVLEGAHYVSDVIFGAYVGIVGPLLIKKYWFDTRALPIRIVLERDRRLAERNAASPKPLAPKQGLSEVGPVQGRNGKKIVDEPRHDFGGLPITGLGEERRPL